MAATGTAQTWDLQRCLNDLRAVREARSRIVYDLAIGMATLAAELRGSYVGATRQQEIADMLVTMQAQLEEIA